MFVLHIIAATLLAGPMECRGPDYPTDLRKVELISTEGIDRIFVDYEIKKLQPRLDKTKRAHYARIISHQAHKWGMDPQLIVGVINAESGFNSNARSRCGAQGLMQLMPGTARDMGVSNPYDEEQNIAGGVMYLFILSTLYHNNIGFTVAAYNAGPGSVYHHHGIPPYPETQLYVVKILSYLNMRIPRMPPLKYKLDMYATR